MCEAFLMEVLIAAGVDMKGGLGIGSAMKRKISRFNFSGSPGTDDDKLP